LRADARRRRHRVEIPARSDVAATSRYIALADYTGLLDERALFLGQWGLRGVKGGEGPSYEELVETEDRPRLRHWLDRLSTEGTSWPTRGGVRYFPAVSEGDDVVVLTEPKPNAPERFRFTFRASSAIGSWTLRLIREALAEYWHRESAKS